MFHMKKNKALLVLQRTSLFINVYEHLQRIGWYRENDDTDYSRWKKKSLHAFIGPESSSKRKYTSCTFSRWSGSFDQRWESTSRELIMYQRMHFYNEISGASTNIHLINGHAIINLLFKIFLLARKIMIWWLNIISCSWRIRICLQVIFSIKISLKIAGPVWPG